MSLPVHVEIFVQAVDEEVEEFFGVLLAVDAPFFVEAGAEVAEGGGSDGLDIVAPERANQIGVDFRHDAVRSFPILLDKVSPAVVEEELGERDGRKKTLNCGVHVAGHTEVDEAGSR